MILTGSPFMTFGIDFPPSQSPPGGLQPDNVPQFVVFGFDDQISPSAFRWVFKMFSGKTNPAGTGQEATYDGTQTTASFYTNTKYGTRYHLEAYNEGHEIGNHTHSHPDGSNASVASWENQINTCNTNLINAGIPASAIKGFRCPFLLYNNNGFKAIQNTGFVYDCSIEEGYEEDQDGTNLFWPYTLDNGSPGNEVLFLLMGENELLTSYPGLWEMPAYYIIIPQEYRAQVKQYNDFFNVENGKWTGLDYNCFDMAKMTGNQFATTLKYNLDLHYNGNRAPFHFGCHSDYYSDSEKQNALVEVVDYALSKPDVRIVSQIKVLEWMLDPVGLDGTEVKHTSKAKTNSLRVRALIGNKLYLSIPEHGTYNISLYRFDGKKVLNLTRQFSQAGDAVVQFNKKKNIPGMVYLVKVTGEKCSVQSKVVVY
jgi:peptidoglycan/xylan/chitin deacetylase (PgdA/CDA1 family)